MSNQYLSVIDKKNASGSFDYRISNKDFVNIIQQLTLGNTLQQIIIANEGITRYDIMLDCKIDKSRKEMLDEAKKACGDVLMEQALELLHKSPIVQLQENGIEPTSALISAITRFNKLRSEAMMECASRLSESYMAKKPKEDKEVTKLEYKSIT